MTHPAKTVRLQAPSQPDFVRAVQKVSYNLHACIGKILT